MKTVFEHSTVNELREMQKMADEWLFVRASKAGALAIGNRYGYEVWTDVGREQYVSAYQVMFTFYSEVSQELKKRMEIVSE